MRFENEPALLRRETTEDQLGIDLVIERRGRNLVCGHAANLLSASRFVLAALWFSAFRAGDQRPAITAPIALAAAISDFVDGRVARWTGSTTGFGQWLDSLADIAFVLTAIACEVRAGAMPMYIPVLIAVSFTQYAIDSVVLRGSSVPVKSRVGHWGGILNYAIVVGLGIAPPPQLLGSLVRAASPLIAIFYIAAIFERALAYRGAGD